MFTASSIRGWLLTAHLVGVIGWIGGLLMLLRIVRYHADEPPSARPSLSRLEGRINWVVAIPSAALATVAGALLVRNDGLAWLRVSLWMHLKLALVLVLVFVHLGVTRAQLRIGKLDTNAPLSRAPWGVLALFVGLLLVAIIALSVHKPWVGGR